MLKYRGKISVNRYIGRSLVTGGRNAGGDLQTESHLSFLGLVFAVFGEEVGKDVPAAAGHVDQRPFLPQTEPRRHGQNQRDGLYHQRPLTQIPADDETAQDGFDLQDGNTGMTTKHT